MNNDYNDNDHNDIDNNNSGDSQTDAIYNLQD